jgi:hypothetical protein
MLDYQDAQIVNRLRDEIEQDEFLAKSMLAKSPTVAKAIQERIKQKRDEISEIYEIGGDYR